MGIKLKIGGHLNSVDKFGQLIDASFWAADPKGTMSYRTEGEFPSVRPNERPNERPNIHPIP